MFQCSGIRMPVARALAIFQDKILYFKHMHSYLNILHRLCFEWQLLSQWYYLCLLYRPFTPSVMWFGLCFKYPIHDIHHTILNSMLICSSFCLPLNNSNYEKQTYFLSSSIISILVEIAFGIIYRLLWATSHKYHNLRADRKEPWFLWLDLTGKRKLPGPSWPKALNLHRTHWLYTSFCP